MAKFYTTAEGGSIFTQNVRNIENEIEKRYTEIHVAVDVSKQNLLQKLNKIEEMETAGKELKNPGEALKLGFDQSILEQIHTCVSIQISKEFRKSASLDQGEVLESIYPKSKEGNLDIPLQMKKSYSPLSSDSSLSPSPIFPVPAQYKKNMHPTVVAVAQGKTDDTIDRALGLAVHPTSWDIYIADAGNRAIKVFDKEGMFKFKFGGEDCNPYGIALSADTVYVTNWGISNFQVFHSEGALLKREEIGLLNKPRGITVDEEGNAFVCSTASNKVVLVNKEKYESKVFAAKHAFREPRDIKIHNGRIVVLDDDNPSLHFFTPQEVHLQSIVATFLQIVTPFAHAYIYDPAFFDMKPDGTIFVTDRQRHYVKIYSPEGKYVTRIGKECDVTTGCFKDPEGIAIGSDGRIYTVCNRRTKMLQVFN